MTDQKLVAEEDATEQHNVERTLVAAHDEFENFISEKLKSYAE